MINKEEKGMWYLFWGYLYPFCNTFFIPFCRKTLKILKFILITEEERLLASKLLLLPPLKMFSMALSSYEHMLESYFRYNLGPRHCMVLVECTNLLRAKRLFIFWPWWLSSGHLLLQPSNFQYCWSQEFLCKIVFF